MRLVLILLLFLFSVQQNVNAFTWQEISDSIAKVQSVYRKGIFENDAYLNKMLRDDVQIAKHISNIVNIGDTLILLEVAEGFRHSRLWIKGKIHDTYVDFYYDHDKDSLQLSPLFSQEVKRDGLINMCDEWRIDELQNMHIGYCILDGPYYLLTKVVFATKKSYKIECHGFAGSGGVIIPEDSSYSHSPRTISKDSLKKLREALMNPAD